MAKSRKVEKETRRLIEGISDLVKRKGDKYKFKHKSKKVVKKIKKQCPHWTIRKGQTVPAVTNDKEHPGYWKCGICGARFPIQPDPIQEYHKNIAKNLEYVNQMMFWSVKLGGDAEDTKMFLRLKELLPRFEKVSKQIRKQVNKRDLMERNKANTEILSQFDAYSGFDYR